MSKKGKSEESQEVNVRKLIFDLELGKFIELDEDGNLLEDDFLLQEEPLQNEEVGIVKEDSQDFSEEQDFSKELEYDILFGTDSKDKKERTIIDPIDNSMEDEERPFAAISIDKEKFNEFLNKVKGALSKISKKSGEIFKNIVAFFVSVFDKSKTMFKDTVNKNVDNKKADNKKVSMNKSVETKAVKTNNTNVKSKEQNYLKDLMEKAKINKKHLVIFSIFIALIAIFSSFNYLYNYFTLPKLSETHTVEEAQNYKNFNAEVHPMQILSSTVSNMREYKGEPNEKGAGKTVDTRYLIYSLDWFGKRRKSILFYNSKNEFYRIKLDIGNDSATFLYDNLMKNLGNPIEDKNPLEKGGYAIWIKDAIKYKLIHRGKFSTIDINIATYDNRSNLPVGEDPIVIQDIRGKDLNNDSNPNERILLLGNREGAGTTRFKKLYLLIWDGEKTYVQEMAEGYNGGNYPQISFGDYNKNGIEDFIISTENEVLSYYNVFELENKKLTNIYSGYEL